MRRKRLWPCEVEAQMTLVGGAEERKTTGLAPKTVSRIAMGLQKFMHGDKQLGPKTKNYWIMIWFIMPGKRAISPAEAERITRRLQKKSIPEIQAFLMKDASAEAKRFLMTFMSYLGTQGDQP